MTVASSGRLLGSGFATSILTSLTVCALASGCSNSDPGAGPEPAQSTTSSSNGSSSPDVSTTDPSEAAVVKVSRALHPPALPVDVVAIVPSSRGGSLVTVQAVGAGGEYLATVAPASTDGSLTPFSLELTGSDGSAEIIVERDAGTQVTVAAVDEGHVVWMEKPGTTLAADRWTMYDYDRADGTVRELAEAPLLDNGSPPPPVPGYTGPILVGERVYWAQVGGERRAETVDVYGCRISACKPEVAVRGAAFPASDGSDLFAAQVSRYSDEVKDGELQVVMLGSGKDETADLAFVADLGKADLTGLAATGSDLGYILSTGSSETLHVVGRDGAPVTTLAGGPMTRFGFPIGLTSTIVFAETGGSSPLNVGGFAYDVTNGEVNTLGNSGGLYNMRGAGEYVAYQESSRTGGVDLVVGQVK